jgi:hypothetical protein
MPTIVIPDWIPRTAMAGDEELPSLGEQPVVAPYDRAELARVAISGEPATDAAVAAGRGGGGGGARDA